MGDFTAWKKQVAEWSKEDSYEPPAGDLTQIKLRVARTCAKCGTTFGHIHRHHKGHEYLWARLLPKCYAHRYVEFRDEDTVDLCNRCHLKIHKLYEIRLYPLWPLLASQDGKVTHKQAELFRQKLIRCCNRWIKEKKNVK